MRSEAQEAAYVEFVTAREGDLRRLAVACAGDVRRSDDILDDALVRLYVAWPRLQREGSEETYVRRLLVRADVPDLPVADHAEPPGSHELTTLRSLPARQRRALALVGLLGLTPAEAGEELGLSPSTVRVAAERAVAAFADSTVAVETPVPAPPAGVEASTPDVPRLVETALDAALAEEAPPRPVAARVAAGRRALRRRRRSATLGTAAALAVVALAPVLLRQGTAPGGGGIDDESPLPSPLVTQAPTPVHLLVAPPRYVRPDTPPVLYLFGRMFKRSRDVTVLATYGEIDTALHPQGGAIVRLGGRTTWVAVVGNEPHRLVEQRVAPYSYTDFTAWATDQLSLMSGHYALSATAPGPYRPPVPDSASPARYDGPRLVAKPGGVVVQRVGHPPVSHSAVRLCDDQAVRVDTAHGDWFVLGYDCGGEVALYSEQVGVRADTLSAWLVQVRRAQDAYAG